MPRNQIDRKHHVHSRESLPHRRTAGHERGQPRPRPGGRGRIPRLIPAALCFGVILAASMALAGGAAAAPSWLVCLEGTGLTKYSNNQCTKAESGGKWQSMELPSGKADTVRLVTPTLTIKDTNTLLGESEVQCYGAGAEVGGIIESPNKGQITEVKYKEPGKNCKGLKVCKETEVTEAKGVNLPWKLELFETETKILTKILAGTGGKEPGWKVVWQNPRRVTDRRMHLRKRQGRTGRL